MFISSCSGNLLVIYYFRPIVMEDFERTVEDFHKDANLKFAQEYEVKKKAILIYICKKKFYNKMKKMLYCWHNSKINDITEILLKVALNTINHQPKSNRKVVIVEAKWILLTHIHAII